jgi:hypothetical protein
MSYRPGVIVVVGGLAALVLLGAPRPTEAYLLRDKLRDALTNPRFLSRGDYVEDTRTGLLWQRDGIASGKRNFYEAAKYAEKLKLGGLSGWRVPTRQELGGIFPATEQPFQNTPYTEQVCCQGPFEWNSYWTCELDMRLPDYAFLYHWYAKGGANNCYASKNAVYVRCVHDPVRKK